MKFRVRDADMGPYVHGKINFTRSDIQLSSHQPRPRYNIAFLHEKLHSIFPVPCPDDVHKDIVILATALGPYVPKLMKAPNQVSITEREYSYVIGPATEGNCYTKDDLYRFIIKTIMWYYKIPHFNKIDEVMRIMKIPLQPIISL